MTTQITNSELFILRRLKIPDAADYRALRLEDLRINPEAFGASFEDKADKPLQWFEERLKNGIIFGGFTKDSQLARAAGLLVLSTVKLAHKAMLRGVFVGQKPADKVWQDRWRRAPLSKLKALSRRSR